MSHHFVRRVRGAAVVALAGMFALSCTNRTADTPPALTADWRAQVDTLGDTIVVHTLSGSQWKTARLVEELSIGVAEGPEHVMFGRIGAIAVTGQGEILIYDSQATQLRRFANDGTFLGPISREGAGPGEYRNVTGMAALPDDRLVLQDFGNLRFNVYSAESELLDSWAQQTDVAEQRPVYTHRDSGIYVYDLLRRAGASESVPSLVRLDARGVAQDTLEIPLVARPIAALQVRSATRSVGMRVPFHPESHWTVTPDGDLVTVDGARYAIDVHRSDGLVLRISRAVSDVPVSEAERTAEEERITARFRRLVPTWSWDGPRTPAIKPPISWLHAGYDGSLWVRSAQPGTALPVAQQTADLRSFVQEPLVFDVFEADGRFRGQVDAPDGLQLSPYPVFTDTHIWAVVRDVNGVDAVVRFRIARD